MRKIIYTAFAAILLFASCGGGQPQQATVQLPAEEIALFTSSDKKLQDAYAWARKTALSYSHDDTDPVGYWYEAALPGREAFCMRDVSHQSVGAQVLGLAKHNLNMFTRFAENISEGKDWCSYWEINRYNLPAPVDYVNDKEFWYNLNANFDVIQACLKMYEWTGDSAYLKDPVFTNFYEKSLNEYVHRWMLEPDRIMDRPRHMNVPENFDPKNHFHTCRGLASYAEDFRSLTVGSDLPAVMYAGYQAYSEMARIGGDHSRAVQAEEAALKYRDLLEEKWWDEERGSYYNFWTAEKKFHHGGGSMSVLWFGATERPERIQAAVADFLSRDSNVEGLSHYPALLYRLGYPDEAYRILVGLPAMKRSDYPEVSYGVVEGVAGGVMGIEPSARNNRVSTLSRLSGAGDSAELKNVPVFDGYVSVRHTGKSESRLTNHTGKTITWRASFMGDHPQLSVNNRSGNATVTRDASGNPVSYVDTEVPDGGTFVAGL